MASDRYIDDATIVDGAALWRRVPPRHFFFDENLGRVQPSSAAFDDHPDGSPMSIVLADLVAESGRGPEDILVNHDGFALAAFAAGNARANAQGVAKDPLPDEPAHGIVFGRKTGAVRRALAKASLWVMAPISS